MVFCAISNFDFLFIIPTIIIIINIIFIENLFSILVIFLFYFMFTCNIVYHKLFDSFLLQEFIFDLLNFFILMK